MPRSDADSGLPSIVCVFPVPVCPYAKIVPFVPFHRGADDRQRGRLEDLELRVPRVVHLVERESPRLRRGVLRVADGDLAARRVALDDLAAAFLELLPEQRAAADDDLDGGSAGGRGTAGG